jgi:N-acetylglucosaminyl-diphospho-decaprenol L-rhamnosyltransferase
VEAAVVVTYAAPPGMLAACLDAISGAGGIGYVVVVDTGGRARDDAQVRAVADAGAIALVEIANDGYGAAANVGFAHARAAGADVVALLNDDVMVRPGWIEALVAELGPGIGAAQPKLLVAGTDPPAVNSLGVQIGSDGAGTDIGLGDLDGATAVPSDLAIFTGGAVAFTGAFLDATCGFDERWFLYYEDVDLARRGAELGWRYRLVPSAVVEHHGGVTTSAMADRTRFLQERNRLWSAFRHEPPATVRRALWLSVRRLRHPPRRVHAKALAAGLAGAPRVLRERRIAARHRS